MTYLLLMLYVIVFKISYLQYLISHLVFTYNSISTCMLINHTIKVYIHTYIYIYIYLYKITLK